MPGATASATGCRPAPVGPCSAAVVRRAAPASRRSAGVLAPVRRRDDFDALSRSRARGRSGPLRVVRAPLPVDDDPAARRVAYALPRAVGSAVVRNRIRRRLRPMMSELAAADHLGPGLYLVGVRPGADALASADLRRHLLAALAALPTPSGRS